MTSWYRTGTVTVTNGSQTVTGTGTLFASNVRVGDMFLGPDGKSYEVQNVASDTVIGIFPGYAGATASGQIYGIVPVQGYVKASADRLRQAVDDYSDKLEGLQPWAYANTAADARDDLELGDMSIQEPNAVAITGGTISGISSLVVAGDVTVVGLARRFKADFSADGANRAIFQTNVLNGTTNIQAIPNGSAASSSIVLCNSSDTTNTGVVYLSAEATENVLNATQVGTGITRPLSFKSGGVTNQVFATNGNAGFGVSAPDASCRIQSANGIKLGNVASPSSVVLDWYERGTFTPTVVGVTSAGSATSYPVRNCSYQRVGNRVNFQMHLQWSGHTGTGAIRINGLPYTSWGGGGYNAVSCYRGNVPVTTDQDLQGFISAGSTSIDFDQVAANGTSFIVPVTAAGILIINGSYGV
jgi:hypothetical protein